MKTIYIKFSFILIIIFLDICCAYKPECDEPTQNSILSPIGLAIDSNNLYVANADLEYELCSGYISKIDVNTDTIVSSIKAELGDDPNDRKHLLGKPILDPTSTKIFFTARESDILISFDLVNNLIDGYVEVGENPYVMAYLPNGDLIVANLESDSLTAVDSSSLSVIKTINIVQGSTGARPDGIALNPNGTRAYIINQLSNYISVIDTDSQSSTYLEEIDTDGDSSNGTTPITIDNGYSGINSRGIAIDPSTGIAYITNRAPDSLVVLDTNNNTIIDFIDLCANPSGVGITNYGDTFVACSTDDMVVVLNSITHDIIEYIGVGEDPYDVAVSQDGNKVYIANLSDNNISVIDSNPTSDNYLKILVSIP